MKPGEVWEIVAFIEGKRRYECGKPDDQFIVLYAEPSGHYPGQLEVDGWMADGGTTELCTRGDGWHREFRRLA